MTLSDRKHLSGLIEEAVLAGARRNECCKVLEMSLRTLQRWELDPEQPRVKNLSFSKRFRHYRNLDQTEKRLEKLLRDFKFTTIREVLGL